MLSAAGFLLVLDDTAWVLFVWSLFDCGKKRLVFYCGPIQKKEYYPILGVNSTIFLCFVVMAYSCMR